MGLRFTALRREMPWLLQLACAAAGITYPVALSTDLLEDGCMNQSNQACPFLEDECCCVFERPTGQSLSDESSCVSFRNAWRVRVVPCGIAQTRRLNRSRL